MVQPASFGFNPETAASNAFQKNEQSDLNVIQHKALQEFNVMVELLNAHDIDVSVFQDESDDAKPDAIFPNNWVSFHEDGTVVLYPMMAKNRRKERRKDIIDALKKDFIINQVIDITDAENNGKFLEGTGSMVFDHANRIVYACHSPRTDEGLLKDLAARLNYHPIIFGAFDKKGEPIYHTNVMLSIGKKFVLICLDAIPDEMHQEVLLDSFAGSGHKVIAISYAQMNAFAGNMLEVQTRHNESVILMSETALQSLLPGQVNVLSELAEILPLKISTIEKCGGGSVRCMVAGLHLPKRNSI
jgi:hypothetical protein